MASSIPVNVGCHQAHSIPVFPYSESTALKADKDEVREAAGTTRCSKALPLGRRLGGLLSEPTDGSGLNNALCSFESTNQFSHTAFCIMRASYSSISCRRKRTNGRFPRPPAMSIHGIKPSFLLRSIVLSEVPHLFASVLRVNITRWFIMPPLVLF